MKCIGEPEISTTQGINIDLQNDCVNDKINNNCSSVYTHTCSTSLKSSKRSETKFVKKLSTKVQTFGGGRGVIEKWVGWIRGVPSLRHTR